MSLCTWCRMCCTHAPDCYVRTGKIPEIERLREKTRKLVEKQRKDKKKKDTK